MIYTFNSKVAPKEEVKSNDLKSTKASTNTFHALGIHEQLKFSKRSKKGCVTCKIRKKKCDELRPTCSDCRRLKKQCIWVDDEMDGEKKSEIKKLVQEKENGTKLRKRKRISSTIEEKSKVSYNPPESLNNPLVRSPIVPATTISETRLKSPDLINLIDSDPDNDNRFLKIIPLPDDQNLFDHQGQIEPYINSNSPLGLTNDLKPSSRDNTPEAHTFDLLNLLKDRSHDLEIDSHSPNLDQIINSWFNPSPKSNPHPIPALNNQSSYLYNHYINIISPTISIAPKTSNLEANYYQQIFLPLANNNIGVLYSILAWACFHIGDQWFAEGDNYSKLALNHFHSMSNSDRSTIINKVGIILVLMGAEICRGDVKNWLKYLEWGSDLFKSNGGILNFNRNKQEHWLIQDFAYHDVLASNLHERGTYFASEDYNCIFYHDLSMGILNPIQGIAKQFYRILADISSLAFESNSYMLKLIKKMNSASIFNIEESSVDSETAAASAFAMAADDAKYHDEMSKFLLELTERADKLEDEINNSKPNINDLFGLPESEFEWQITLFEAFRLSTKLYLRQSIFKCNPTTLESRIITNDLIKCLDIIIGSPVRASIAFPLFISGMHCVGKFQRASMKKRITTHIELFGPWSISRVLYVIEKIWELNPDGDKFIDWHKTLKDLNWHINFA